MRSMGSLFQIVQGLVVNEARLKVLAGLEGESVLCGEKA